MVLGRHAQLYWVLAIATLGLLGVLAFERPTSPDPPTPTSLGRETGDAAPRAFQFARKPENSGNQPFSRPFFTDVHEQLGLQFRYDGWVRGLHLMVESTGGAGGTWLDIDNDGYTDAVFAQGGDPTGKTVSPDLIDRLFRNIDAGEFVDVTALARLDSGRGYGQGIAVGDFDNDGFDDIYLTRLESNCLLWNQGDGTFVDVTEQSSTDSPYWSTSAAWGDWDRDGDLDLFVCNYVDFDVHDPIECRRKQDGSPGMCSPSQFQGIPNAAFLNEGNGHFREVSLELGLRSSLEVTKSLGVVIAELTGDEWPDIFVANDEAANSLFTSDDGLSFRDVGNAVGCAFGRDGETQASMGIAFGDYDRNGMQDLCLSHFYQQTNTLYANQPGGGFVDASRLSGLTDVAYDLLGWGTVMLDFNQDGHMDMFTANGHVHNNEDLGEPFRMRPQVVSISAGRWRDAGAKAGDYFDREFIGRGVSAGDYDQDGDFDLLVGHHLDDAALLRNESERGNWLKLKLVGTDSNRRAIGAQVTLIQPNQRLVAQIPGGTSYCSTQEPILIFGLGDDDTDVTLEIQWPNGKQQRVDVGSPNRLVTAVEPVSSASAGSTYIGRTRITDD